MKSPSLISVVLVTCGRFISILKRSLDSIIAQTYENIEVTIVDCNIDSNMSQSISDYVSSLDQVKLHFIRLPGASNNLARNTGFKASKGDYIAFLDDDDEWVPDKLEQQVELFKKGVSIVYSNYFVTNEEGEKDLFFTDVPINKNLKTKILGENVIGCTSMPLISSKAFIEAGGFDESLKANQDWDLWIRVLQEKDAEYSPGIAGIKYYTQNSISNDRYRRAGGWIRLLMKHAGKYLRNRDQLTKATGFFTGEMFSKKLYFTGTVVIVVHFLSKIRFK